MIFKTAAALLTVFSLAAPVLAATPTKATVAFFQTQTQTLVDAIATGDRAVWDRALAAEYALTDEEGRVIGRREFLDELTGLPKGFSGNIVVKDLTVDEYPAFAVVRYLDDEHENVFGQELHTFYRATDIYRKDGAGWKLVATQVTVVPSDPEALVTPSGKELARLEGTYQLGPGRDYLVRVRDGKLFGGRNETSLKEMIPLSPLVFVPKGGIYPQIFVLDGSGKATKLVQYHKFEEVIQTRVN
jgi:uncharacterized protein DUF4440